MDCVASLSATVGSAKPAAVAFGFDGWSAPGLRWAMSGWAAAANLYQRCSFDGSGSMDGGTSLREQTHCITLQAEAIFICIIR